MPTSIKTIVIFLRPVEPFGFNETLPPGGYELDTQIPIPLAGIRPDVCKSSVLVRLYPRMSHPGLDRTLTIPLVELERAAAKDKLTGPAVTGLFLEEMLADPMIRLVMKADGFEGERERSCALRGPRGLRAGAAPCRGTPGSRRPNHAAAYRCV